MAPPVEQPDSEPAVLFHERTTLQNGMSAAGVSAFAGLLVSSVQNSLSKHKAGALGVFTRTGSTIALFTAMGGIFSLVDSFAANTRRQDDALNGAIGGCAAGLVAGASGGCFFSRVISIAMLILFCLLHNSTIGPIDGRFMCWFSCLDRHIRRCWKVNIRIIRSWNANIWRKGDSRWCVHRRRAFEQQPGSRRARLERRARTKKEAILQGKCLPSRRLRMSKRLT
jgi:hypothetical protein